MEYKRLNDYLNELKFNKRADLLSTTGKELLIELEHALKQLTLTDVVKSFYCWNSKCDGKKCKNQCMGCEYYEEKELKQ